MYRSDLKKFIFIHIPKTGGTSVKKYLYEYANKDQLLFNGDKVIDLNNWHPHEPMNYQDYITYKAYLKFTFVRNPWARHASLWKFLHARKDPHGGYMWFTQYIQAVCKGQLIYSRNQSDYFTDNGWVMIDYVGRFEAFEEDFKEILEKLNIPFYKPMPHIKDQGDYDYHDMYTNEIKDLIYKHCMVDIKQFKYEF